MKKIAPNNSTAVQQPAKQTVKQLKLSLVVQYVIDDDQLVRSRLRRWVHKTLNLAAPESVSTAQITLRLVDLAESQQLNSTYRTKDKPTNVLTFAYNDPSTPDNLIADIVICTPVLKKEAIEQGKTYLNHATHLVIHGTLHALGYDHINTRDAEVMEAIETEILATFSIADPYST